MHDIPVFTTENGIASLTLKEIPYKSEAYIRIQASETPLALLAECCDFCKGIGAKHIYATGHACLDVYPLYTTLWKMNCPKDCLPETDATVFPVQQETLETWREIYNERMKAVPNASYMTVGDAQKMLQKGNGYFVHREEMLIGIGTAYADTIGTVASVIPRAGENVLLALCKALTDELVTLEVASTNYKAVTLYERLGFVKVAEISKWYKIK